MHKEVKKKSNVLAIISCICLIAVFLFYYSGIDVSVHNYFYPVGNGTLTTIMNDITLIGSTAGIVIISLIVLLILLIKKEYRASSFYLVSVFGSMIINSGLKNIFHRIRPNGSLNDFAFPSGHSMSSAVVFGALALLIWNKNRKLATCLLLFPLLIGFSRIYLDVHWVSDVFGGFFFGSSWIAIIYYLFYGMKK